MQQPRVAILQPRLPHYRVAFFEALRAGLAARAIDLALAYSPPSAADAARSDTGRLAWAIELPTRAVRIAGRDLLWQAVPRACRDAQLVILPLENRILSNYPLLAARRLRGKPVAFWGHGANLQSRSPQGVRERWKRLWLRRADWWFAYTELSVRILRDAGFPETRITCVNNTIDTRAFAAQLAAVSQADERGFREALGVPASAPVGIHCGSLYPDKRLDLLLEAAAIVRSRVPSFHLVVIGDGPSAPTVLQAARSQPWIHALGARTGREKALAFRAALVMLNPGAVGLHVLDSFVAGVPMVTTGAARHGPEIVYLRDRLNGVIAGDSPREFAAAVEAILVEESHRSRLAAGARRGAEEFSIDAMAASFVDGVTRCLAAAR
jgi:glycosyltransferase involved in cell wall biosynthesis